MRLTYFSVLTILHVSVGYIRIFLTITACYWMFTDPLKAVFCFTMSHTILDDLDGIAARRFKQGVCVCVFESLPQQLPIEEGGRELVHCTLSQ